MLITVAEEIVKCKIIKIIYDGLEVKLDMRKLFLFLRVVVSLMIKEKYYFKGVGAVSGDFRVVRSSLVKLRKWLQSEKQKRKQV